MRGLGDDAKWCDSQTHKKTQIFKVKEGLSRTLNSPKIAFKVWVYAAFALTLSIRSGALN